MKVHINMIQIQIQDINQINIPFKDNLNNF